jgi:quinol monooxygenase YgiN
VKKISLSVIVDAIEETTDGWEQFYNTVTGEVESVPDMDNDYADFSEFEETMGKIDDSDDYIRLPSQQELHEYNIMERFAEEKDSNELMRALRGRKPFRTFKDTAIDLGLDKEYYAFRTEAYRDIAREWCRSNEIPFTEDGSADKLPITMNLYYTGKNGAACRFAEEMESSGTAEEIRQEKGNFRYEYYFSMKDPETVLLIDSWSDQEAIDAHHASPMMAKIAELREKYDLHMRAERFVSQENTDEEFLRQ